MHRINTMNANNKLSEFKAHFVLRMTFILILGTTPDDLIIARTFLNNYIFCT